MLLRTVVWRISWRVCARTGDLAQRAMWRLQAAFGFQDPKVGECAQSRSTTIRSGSCADARRGEKAIGCAPWLPVQGSIGSRRGRTGNVEARVAASPARCPVDHASHALAGSSVAVTQHHHGRQKGRTVGPMEASNLRPRQTPRRQVPRRLDETTNGHPIGSEIVSSSEYPSSDEDEGGTTQGRREDDSRLRRSTPAQLLEAHDRATERWLFVSLIFFRILVALVTSRTVFAPDEHWQSLEVAHQVVFGYGYQTWEWRDRRALVGMSGWSNGPIRSFIYPAFFVPLYWLLQKLGLDETILLVGAKG